MKKTALVLLATGCLVWTGTTTVWAGGIGKVTQRQSARIHQGIHSGALTCGETRALIQEQHRLHHAGRTAWSDGALTVRERDRLAAMHQRAARHIYRLKQNDRKRW